MKAQFEIKNFLANNREVVIAKYNELQNENFFDGISLKDFMFEVMNLFVMNRVKSEKTATSKLPFFISMIFCKHNTIGVVNSLDKESKELKNLNILMNQR